MIPDALIQSKLTHAFHEKGFKTPIIAVTGGKGGVGKTTVAVNIATALMMQEYRVALADADVDAPNAAILTGIPLENPEPVSVMIPQVHGQKCIRCGNCVKACRRNALFLPPKASPVLMGECNGCEACMLVCPSGAISRGNRQAGNLYKTRRDTLTLYTGELVPGTEESTFVVNALKKRLFDEADEYDIIIVDSAPGTHCNVINALKGADFVIAVTEPTPLGAHDLELILRVSDAFCLESGVILNRADLPGRKEEIKEIAKRHKADIIASIPMDDALARSYVEGLPVVTKTPESISAKRLVRIADDIVKEYL